MTLCRSQARGPASGTEYYYRRGGAGGGGASRCGPRGTPPTLPGLVSSPATTLSGFDPPLSNCCGFTAYTLYTPGSTSLNLNSPSASVAVVSTTILPSPVRSSTAVPGCAADPRNTFPLILPVVAAFSASFGVGTSTSI